MSLDIAMVPFVQGGWGQIYSLTFIIPQSVTSAPDRAWWRSWVIKKWSTDRNEHDTRVLGTDLESDWGVVDLSAVPFCFDSKIVLLRKDAKNKVG